MPPPPLLDGYRPPISLKQCIAQYFGASISFKISDMKTDGDRGEGTETERRTDSGRMHVTPRQVVSDGATFNSADFCLMCKKPLRKRSGIHTSLPLVVSVGQEVPIDTSTKDQCVEGISKVSSTKEIVTALDDENVHIADEDTQQQKHAKEGQLREGERGTRGGQLRTIYLCDTAAPPSCAFYVYISEVAPPSPTLARLASYSDFGGLPTNRCCGGTRDSYDQGTPQQGVQQKTNKFCDECSLVTSFRTRLTERSVVTTAAVSSAATCSNANQKCEEVSSFCFTSVLSGGWVGPDRLVSRNFIANGMNSTKEKMTMITTATRGANRNDVSGMRRPQSFLEELLGALHPKDCEWLFRFCAIVCQHSPYEGFQHILGISLARGMSREVRHYRRPLSSYMSSSRGGRSSSSSGGARTLNDTRNARKAPKRSRSSEQHITRKGRGEVNRLHRSEGKDSQRRLSAEEREEEALRVAVMALPLPTMPLLHVSSSGGTSSRSHVVRDQNQNEGNNSNERLTGVESTTVFSFSSSPSLPSRQLSLPQRLALLVAHKRDNSWRNDELLTKKEDTLHKQKATPHYLETLKAYYLQGRPEVPTATKPKPVPMAMPASALSNDGSNTATVTARAAVSAVKRVLVDAREVWRNSFALLDARRERRTKNKSSDTNNSANNMGRGPNGRKRTRDKGDSGGEGCGGDNVRGRGEETRGAEFVDNLNEGRSGARTVVGQRHLENDSRNGDNGVLHIAERISTHGGNDLDVGADGQESEESCKIAEALKSSLAVVVEKRLQHTADLFFAQLIGIDIRNAALRYVRRTEEEAWGDRVLGGSSVIVCQREGIPQSTNKNTNKEARAATSASSPSSLSVSDCSVSCRLVVDFIMSILEPIKYYHDHNGHNSDGFSAVVAPRPRKDSEVSLLLPSVPAVGLTTLPHHSLLPLPSPSHRMNGEATSATSHSSNKFTFSCYSSPPPPAYFSTTQPPHSCTPRAPSTHTYKVTTTTPTDCSLLSIPTCSFAHFASTSTSPPILMPMSPPPSMSPNPSSLMEAPSPPLRSLTSIRTLQTSQERYAATRKKVQYESFWGGPENVKAIKKHLITWLEGGITSLPKGYSEEAYISSFRSPTVGYSRDAGSMRPSSAFLTSNVPTTPLLRASHFLKSLSMANIPWLRYLPLPLQHTRRSEVQQLLFAEFFAGVVVKALIPLLLSDTFYFTHTPRNRSQFVVFPMRVWRALRFDCLGAVYGLGVASHEGEGDEGGVEKDRAEERKEKEDAMMGGTSGAVVNGEGHNDANVDDSNRATIKAGKTTVNHLLLHTDRNQREAPSERFDPHFPPHHPHPRGTPVQPQFVGLKRIKPLDIWRKSQRLERVLPACGLVLLPDRSSGGEHVVGTVGQHAAAAAAPSATVRPIVGLKRRRTVITSCLYAYVRLLPDGDKLRPIATLRAATPNALVYATGMGGKPRARREERRASGKCKAHTSLKSRMGFEVDSLSDGTAEGVALGSEAVECGGPSKKDTHRDDSGCKATEVVRPTNDLSSVTSADSNNTFFVPTTTVTFPAPPLQVTNSPRSPHTPAGSKTPSFCPPLRTRPNAGILRQARMALVVGHQQRCRLLGLPPFISSRSHDDEHTEWVGLHRMCLRMVKDLTPIYSFEKDKDKDNVRPRDGLSQHVSNYLSRHQEEGQNRQCQQHSSDCCVETCSFLSRYPKLAADVFNSSSLLAYAMSQTLTQTTQKEENVEREQHHKGSATPIIPSSPSQHGGAPHHRTLITQLSSSTSSTSSSPRTNSSAAAPRPPPLARRACSRSSAFVPFLYFVRGDAQRCYDSLPQEAVAQCILETLPHPRYYTVRMTAIIPPKEARKGGLSCSARLWGKQKQKGNEAKGHKRANNRNASVFDEFDESSEDEAEAFSSSFSSASVTRQWSRLVPGDDFEQGIIRGIPSGWIVEEHGATNINGRGGVNNSMNSSNSGAGKRYYQPYSHSHSGVRRAVVGDISSVVLAAAPPHNLLVESIKCGVGRISELCLRSNLGLRSSDENNVDGSGSRGESEVQASSAHVPPQYAYEAYDGDILRQALEVHTQQHLVAFDNFASSNGSPNTNNNNNTNSYSSRDCISGHSRRGLVMGPPPSMLVYKQSVGLAQGSAVSMPLCDSLFLAVDASLSALLAEHAEGCHTLLRRVDDVLVATTSKACALEVFSRIKRGWPDVGFICAPHKARCTATASPSHTLTTEATEKIINSAQQDDDDDDILLQAVPWCGLLVRSLGYYHPCHDFKYGHGDNRSLPNTATKGAFTTPSVEEDSATLPPRYFVSFSIDWGRFFKTQQHACRAPTLAPPGANDTLLSTLRATNMLRMRSPFILFCPLLLSFPRRLRTVAELSLVLCDMLVRKLYNNLPYSRPHTRVLLKPYAVAKSLLISHVCFRQQERALVRSGYGSKRIQSKTKTTTKEKNQELPALTASDILHPRDVSWCMAVGLRRALYEHATEADNGRKRHREPSSETETEAIREKENTADRQRQSYFRSRARDERREDTCTHAVGERDGAFVHSSETAPCMRLNRDHTLCDHNCAPPNASAVVEDTTNGGGQERKRTDDRESNGKKKSFQSILLAIGERKVREARRSLHKYYDNLQCGSINNATAVNDNDRSNARCDAPASLDTCMTRQGRDDIGAPLTALSQQRCFENRCCLCCGAHELAFERACNSLLPYM